MYTTTVCVGLRDLCSCLCDYVYVHAYEAVCREPYDLQTLFITVTQAAWTWRRDGEQGGEPSLRQAGRAERDFRTA